MSNKDSVVFSSRKEAREFKKKHSGSFVTDLGVGASPRWKVSYAVEKQPVGLGDELVHKVKPKVDYSRTVVIITPQNVAITLSDGTQHNVNREKGEFSKVVELALSEQYEEMMKYVDIANAVKVFTFGTDIKIEGGLLYYNNQEVDSSIATRIVEESTKSGGDVERYVNFFRKLYKNPSYKAVEHTYDFMVHNDLEILPNGDIKAWKSVNVVDNVPIAAQNVPNWKDTTIEMPRNQVEDNPNITCSHGLHIASKEYAENYSSLLLEVSVSPEDIVSVPVDYKNQKCRCCKYTVLTGMEAPEGTTKHLLIDKNGNVL